MHGAGLGGAAFDSSGEAATEVDAFWQWTSEQPI
jgi:hypothetical protein